MQTDDAIYRYFLKNPSWTGGAETSCANKNISGGTITVMPCGVITFSGSYTPEQAQYIGIIGGFDSDLANLVAREYESEEDPDTVVTDIVNSGGIMVYGADESSDMSMFDITNLAL